MKIGIAINTPRNQIMTSKKALPNKKNENFLGKWLVPNWRQEI
jgi:hypothetical protein